MFYKSTRGGAGSVLSADAIKKGIAPDGGLFVPESVCKLELEQIGNMVNMTYRERATAVLKYYIDDYTDEEIEECVENAYARQKFEGDDIAPVRKLNENVYILELWHGPTCAFKDMALQILPHLLVNAVRKTGENSRIVILVATSGDTGKAALEGFKDVSGTEIIVFYPYNGVSEVQKMQMVTQEGKNVHAIAVEGNFDDAQNGVKAIFTNPELNGLMALNGIKFSSANSINWGRLLPQIVYYFSAYADMVKKGDIRLGDKINVVVPTGNFGNILAAYYSLRMGLPINKMICASNENNVLTDFINTGRYDSKREFKRTVSPSMDILISSNLERLLFEITDHDSNAVKGWMEQLKENGEYTVDDNTRRKLSKLFWAGYTNENETLKTIEYIYNEYNYVVDTHTAVGIDVYDKYVISTGDVSASLIASTASPFKFNESVARAIFGESEIEGKSEFQLLDALSEECGLPIPQGLANLDKKTVIHKGVCSREEMAEQVKKILNI
ncbi:L-threonine synthase [Anaerobacterium chartisolvens]|uniref:Threonine synthase n=1 Tax=Anaerobacterium chartisolvens TaxID=1297424 RepID=A0A369BHU2_9FIRM|nr:threonine synthase [Anaerobacterium chartisolvens]RCX20138.1 L-threonine synthase [Anaerobacterium chartisolvens]